MTKHRNAQGQPIGADVPGWISAAPIPKTPIHGTYCDVVPLSMDHAPDLFTAYSADTSGTLWTYMPVGPFDNAPAFATWLDTACNSHDPLFFAVIDRSNGKAIGIASYLRIDPGNGVAEVGFIAFSPALQRTTMATEAMYLMMRRVFDELGYRRYEWKCDAMNAASQAAAKRLGFSYDGLFRQAVVYKGRNRDTAWFSILDRDWPRIRKPFEAWLAPDNFSAAGQQKTALSTFMQTSDGKD
ncbi:GNAT family N-acetyltransferase [Loktanella agnita]|uniref:GNAT family N-acetyltransferase n=1 Tax=Loktanella agnita TaxID=287097 RepID=UPI003987E58A